MFLSEHPEQNDRKLKHQIYRILNRDLQIIYIHKLNPMKEKICIDLINISQIKKRRKGNEKKSWKRWCWCWINIESVTCSCQTWSVINKEIYQQCDQFY